MTSLGARCPRRRGPRGVLRGPRAAAFASESADSHLQILQVLVCSWTRARTSQAAARPKNRHFWDPSYIHFSIPPNSFPRPVTRIST